MRTAPPDPPGSQPVPDGGFELSYALDLARPAGDIFSFLADSASFKVVDTALQTYEPDGRLALGVTGRMTHRRGGMTARTTWAVTAFEESRHLEVEIHGLGYAMTESASLEETSTGTRVTFVDRVWPTSLWGRLLVALSGGIMRRDLRTRAARLKTVLEGAPDDRR